MDNGFDQYKELFLARFADNQKEHAELAKDIKVVKSCVGELKVSMAKLEEKNAISWRIHAWIIPAIIAGAVTLALRFL
jgi:hypothetical protein